MFRSLLINSPGLIDVLQHLCYLELKIYEFYHNEIKCFFTLRHIMVYFKTRIWIVFHLSSIWIMQTLSPTTHISFKCQQTCVPMYITLTQMKLILTTLNKILLMIPICKKHNTKCLFYNDCVSMRKRIKVYILVMFVHEPS